MRRRFWLFVLATSLLTNVVAADDEAVRIVTLGDSITKGVRAGVTVEETFAARLQAGLQKQGITAKVTNVGIGGERSDQALARLDKVIALKPRIVTVMYGTNDSYVDIGRKDSRITSEAYGKNLAEIVRRLRKAGIVPILMTEPRWGKQAKFNGVGEHPNLRLEKYVDVCRKVATQMKTPLVDHFRSWTTEENAGKQIGDWTTDQCHPNPEGHRILAELMLPVVLKTIKGN